MSLEFLLTTLVIVAAPGSGVIYVLSAGLARGKKASVLAAFSCTLGIVPHLIAVLLGLAALLHTSALLFNVVKYAGILYLLYMAWQCLRGKGALNIGSKADRRSSLVIIRDGILLNFLNPKLSIFFVAFLPQFISPADPTPFLTMLSLSGVFMLFTFVVFAIYGIFAALAREKVIGSPTVLKWLRRSFAAAFGGVAIKLAISER